MIVLFSLRLAFEHVAQISITLQITIQWICCLLIIMIPTVWFTFVYMHCSNLVTLHLAVIILRTRHSLLNGQMKPAFTVHAEYFEAFSQCSCTSIKQIRRQTVDWDAIISPLKVLRIQNCRVFTEDKRKTHEHDLCHHWKQSQNETCICNSTVINKFPP